MWQGGFVNPVESYTTLVDYGQVRVVNGRQGSRSNSTKLYTIPGEPCRAPANGVVVLAAELALTGNTVVIDHGCGMRSYLYRLQALSVSAGQTVEKGAGRGRAGRGADHGLQAWQQEREPVDAVPDQRRIVLGRRTAEMQKASDHCGQRLFAS